MPDCMTFPDTVEEFMDSYKIVDTEQVYTNGTEMVPIYRMRQWFQHEPERKKGKWLESDTDGFVCSVCRNRYRCQPTLMGKPMFEYCPVCGADMREETDDQSK